MKATIVKHAVIAATLALAAVASWAMTDYHVPGVDATMLQGGNN